MECSARRDANDIERIQSALEVFRQTKNRPTFIILDSHIGYGSPNRQDTAEAHGEPLGEEEVRLTKRAYGWPEDAKFFVPDGVYDHFKSGIGKRGAEARKKWTELFANYRVKFPELAAEIDQMQRRELPAGWDRNLPVFPADAKGIAGRDASGQMLNILAQNIPWLVGGSADLGPSNKTTLKYPGAGDFNPITAAERTSISASANTRNGGDVEWALSFKATTVRCDILYFQRLRQTGYAALGTHGVAHHFYFHARCDGAMAKMARRTNR